MLTSAIPAVAALLLSSCATVNEPRGAGEEARADPALGTDREEQRFTFSCVGFNNGVWCGGNKGFPGSPYILYYCSDGVGTVVQVCPGLCHAQTWGVEDHC